MYTLGESLGQYVPQYRFRIVRLFCCFAPWRDSLPSSTGEVRNRMTTTEIGPVLLALCSEDPPPGHAPELENAELIRLANPARRPATGLNIMIAHGQFSEV